FTKPSRIFISPVICGRPRTVIRYSVWLHIGANRTNPYDQHYLDSLKSGVHILEIISRRLLLTEQYELTSKLGYMIMDNTTNNDTAGQAINEELIRRTHPPREEHFLFDCTLNVSVFTCSGLTLV